MDKPNIIRRTIPESAKPSEASNIGTPERHGFEQNTGAWVKGHIVKRIEQIESGEAPAVDPQILADAKKAISHETGGIDHPKVRLQHFLELLHGDGDDPARTLDELLNTSSSSPDDRGQGIG